MRGQVYRIDFPNGYFYIGKSKNLETRILQHYSGIDGRFIHIVLFISYFNVGIKKKSELFLKKGLIRVCKGYKLGI